MLQPVSVAVGTGSCMDMTSDLQCSLKISELRRLLQPDTEKHHYNKAIIMVLTACRTAVSQQSHRSFSPLKHVLLRQMQGGQSYHTLHKTV